MSDIKMPILFIGHGNPMNAIEDNEFSRTWQDAATRIPVPRAIVCISAHWETQGTQITAMGAPRTIHDFYGFPRELFEVQYKSPGSPELASHIIHSIKKFHVSADQNWGLDHGTWSVLNRMYPEARIPVVQLSLDRSIDPAAHYELGSELRFLRDQGVLIIGSGNIVHNLGLMVWEDAAFDWASEYDANVKQWIVNGEHDEIVHYERHGKAALLAVNSAEHFLPLLYVLGARETGDQVSFFAEKVWGGSLSMRCVRIG